MVVFCVGFPGIDLCDFETLGRCAEYLGFFRRWDSLDKSYIVLVEYVSFRKFPGPRPVLTDIAREIRSNSAIEDP